MKYNLRNMFRMAPVPAFALALAFAFTGCITDDAAGPGSDRGSASGEVRITVSIPGAVAPSTRSIAGAGGEAVVSEVDLLVFEKNATPGQPDILVEHVQGEIVSQSTSEADDYKVTFTAAMTGNPDASSVVVVANAHAWMTLLMSLNPVGSSKQDVLEGMIYVNHSKWGANPDDNADPEMGTDYDGIPMYGEKAISGVEAGMTVTGIELTRMLARIDVVNNATDVFTLTKVHLAHQHLVGYMAPAWNTADGELLNVLPAAPMIPSSSFPSATPFEYDYVAGGLTGEIYTFEAPAATGAEGTLDYTHSTCLILEGTLAGDPTTYYYRVDFTDPSDATGKMPGEAGYVAPGPESVEYMSIYRNHLYRFDIAAVEGKGFLTFAEAENSLGVLSNLKTSLLVVDQSGIRNTVFNGQHYLGVERAEVTVEIGGGTEFVKVSTNYYYGWKTDDRTYTGGIEYLGSDSGWLTEITGGSDAAGTTDLEFTVPENTTLATREAYIHLMAGRLTHKVKVVQKPALLWGGENHVLYFLPDGTLGIGRGEELTTLADLAFFKFGGVVGFTNGATFDVETSVVFDPSKYDRVRNGTDDGNTIIGYGNPSTVIPFVPGYVAADFNAGRTNVSEPYYHNGANILLGRGDPCRLVGFKSGDFDGKTAAEIEDMLAAGDAGWRLPTALENAYFVGGPKLAAGVAQNVYSISSTEIGNNSSANYYDAPAGTLSAANFAKAWFPVVQGDSPNRAGLSLPAAGFRTTSNGQVLTQGIDGRYWSSTAGSNINAFVMDFGAGTTLNTSGVSGFSAGTSIRCVRIADEPAGQKTATTTLTLNHTGNDIPTGTGTNHIPAAGGTYTENVSTNLQGWGVRVYSGADNTGTLLLDKPAVPLPVISVQNAAVASAATLVIPNSEEERTVTVYLYAPELGSGKADEILVGSYTQAALEKVYAAPGVIGIKKSDYDALWAGTKTVGDGTYDLTLKGSSTYATGQTGTAAVENIADADFGGLESEPVYTVYFKWGSMIAMIGGMRDTWSADGSDVVWAPSGLDPSVSFTTYEGFTPSPWDGSANGDKDYYQPFDTAKGHGDPCTIFGGWRTPRGNYWRLPDGTAPFGTGTDSWTTGSFVPYTEILSGPAGSIFGGAMSSDGGMYLPAAGYRSLGGPGTMSNVGITGQYWSSTSGNSTRGYILNFDKTDVSAVSFYDYGYGLSVRCVK